MKLTKEQRDAVAALGNAFVDARPGSGKTRVVTGRAIRAARDLGKSNRKVACITFTNAAVDEMVRRVKASASPEEGNRIDVYTIHSFCLSQIFRPYHYALSPYKHGFELVAGDDDRAKELMRDLIRKHGVRLKPHDVEMLGSCPVDVQGRPLGVAQSCVALMEEYWDEFRSRAWVDFSLLLFESLRVLHARPEVTISLSAKYPTIVVDEFQDTTTVQLEVLRNLYASGSSEFFLVGDINQSIYRFAGADTSASWRFVQQIGARQDLPLSGNFRSSSRIVAKAEALIACSPPMQAVGEFASVDLDVEIYASSNPAAAVLERFVEQARGQACELGRCGVLAAWWTDLLPIARYCVARGIPVVGPGARPYKRGRLIVPILENLAAVAEKDLALSSTQRALRRSLEEFEGCEVERLTGWAGCKIALELREEAVSLVVAHNDPLQWIIAVGESLDELLDRRGVLRNERRLHASAQEVVNDLLTNNRVDLHSLSIQSLGLFADPENALKLMTVHAAKGREFDAVAIACANEGRFPHFTATTQPQIEDGRRSLYVAVTRAKRLLHIVIDSSDYRNRPSRFLESLH